MLNLVCVHFREMYDDTYVNRLYSMVKRNLSLPFQFTCVTDRVRDVYPEIEQEVRNDVQEGRGSRNKLQLFNPEFLPFDSMLYMDLTLIVRASLDEMIHYAVDKDFVTIKDWNYTSFNSCVMWIGRSARTRKVWDTFASGHRFEQKTAGGDQDYIYNVFRENNWLDDVSYFPEGSILPFRKTLKLHRKEPKAALEQAMSASIIKFHGHPKPHEWANPVLRLKYIMSHRPFCLFHDWGFLAEETKKCWQ